MYKSIHTTNLIINIEYLKETYRMQKITIENIGK